MKVRGWHVILLWLLMIVLFISYEAGFGWMVEYESASWIEGMIIGIWLVVSALGFLFFFFCCYMTDTWMKGGKW